MRDDKDSIENRVHGAAALCKLLEEMRAEGFTTVVLRNPKTGETKTLDIPIKK
jgi:hypothetical protein